MKKSLVVVAVVMGIFSGNVLAAKKTPNQEVEASIETMASLQSCVDRSVAYQFQDWVDYFKRDIAKTKHTLTKDQMKKIYSDRYQFWTKANRTSAHIDYCMGMKRTMAEIEAKSRAERNNPFN